MEGQVLASAQMGASSLTDKVGGFLAEVRQEDQRIILDHCLVHCEAALSETLPVLKDVSDEPIKTVNLTSRPLNSRIFPVLYQ
jgi:hypothetical protein